MEGTTGFQRALPRRAPAHRSQQAHARQPGGRAAAGARARVPALETGDARGLALGSTHLYAARRRRLVRADRARFRARARTPAEARQATRRIAALPVAGARDAGARARAEGARRDRGQAERRPDFAARRRSRAAHRSAAGRRPGGPARQRDSRPQRAVATPDLAGETSRARSERRLPSGPDSSTTRSSRTRCSRHCRARRSARGRKRSWPRRGGPCTTSRARC